MAQILNPISDQDIELLSAYLDDELGVSQRAALEMRLSADANLAAHLTALRRTIDVVRAVPQMRPPRNFTLNPATFAKKPAWWMRSGFLQTMGSFGAAAATILIVGGVLLSSGQVFNLNGNSSAAPQAVNNVDAADSEGAQPAAAAGIASAPTMTTTNFATSTMTVSPQSTLLLATSTPDTFSAKSGAFPTATRFVEGTAARYASTAQPTMMKPADQLPSDANGGMGGGAANPPVYPSPMQPNPAVPQAGGQSGFAPVQPPYPSPFPSPAPTQTQVVAAALAAESATGTATGTSTGTPLDKAAVAPTQTHVVNQPTMAALMPTTIADSGSNSGSNSQSAQADQNTATSANNNSTKEVVTNATYAVPQLMLGIGIGLMVLSLMLLALNWVRRHTGV